ncbi:prepilin-type N-terminal cleavage/methylation domain-containing protein [Neobacillus niacini]|uniref:prepilin-type N-terminal cleavage/methylation domain-containing protein n=1 Tax=Neobacillus niacini TaxID=86668 RepID=UPI003983792C
MKLINNEKGVTLIEVIISIAILSILLISFMNFFPQMGLMNRQNEDKTQAINTAKNLLVDWQESIKVKGFLTKNNQGSGFTPNNIGDKEYYTHFDPNPSGSDYIFKTTKDNYDVNITISKNPRKNSNAYSVHLIIVQLLNDKGNTVSETYGYIRR